MKAEEVTTLDDSQKALLQTQYNLTNAQMHDIDKQFQDLATNGGITRHKFINAFTGAGVGAEYAGILFDSFDLDGNKKITINEWYALMGMRLGGSAEDRLRASFKMFDKNNDGSLSRSELVELISLVQFHKRYYEYLKGGRILTNTGKIHLRQETDNAANTFVKKLITAADTDQNGSIDIEEFVSGFMADSHAMAAINLFAQAK